MISERKNSFEDVDYWTKELEQKLQPGTFSIAIVGNKVDLPEDDKQVNTTKAYQYAKERDYMFAEISAKTGDGVSEIFQEISERVYSLKTNNQLEDEN